jgi:6-phosphogluconate dehydrogenase
VLKEAAEDKNVNESMVHGFTLFEKFVNAFKGLDKREKPRIYVLCMHTGEPVDGVEDDTLPLLDKRDIIIDGGNEWWPGTEKRQKKGADVMVECAGLGMDG